MEIIKATVAGNYGMEHHASIKFLPTGWHVEYTVKEPTCISQKTKRFGSYDEASDFFINWQKRRLDEIKKNIPLE